MALAVPLQGDTGANICRYWLKGRGCKRFNQGRHCDEGEHPCIVNGYEFWAINICGSTPAGQHCGHRLCFRMHVERTYAAVVQAFPHVLQPPYHWLPISDMNGTQEQVGASKLVSFLWLLT
jgi:hypothetical protein